MKTIGTDVLIVGAGAAGLTLAIELARRNVDFRLIDKAPQPFPGSRGKGIQPRTLEVFDDMGVVDRIAAAGGRYPVQRLYGGDGFVDEPMIEDREPVPAEPYAVPLMVPQFVTEGILRDRLLELGHRPHFGAELTGFEQDAEGVTAMIAAAGGRETVGARFLVGTDGGRSAVRHLLGIDFPGKTLGIRAVVADLDLSGLGDDAWHRWNEGTPDQISLCPLRGTGMFQLQAPVPFEGDIAVSVEGLGAMIRERAGRTDIVVHAVHWASVYTMNARLADRYRVGRVLLGGDAAHIHPPTGGQGLNTSVQDCYNLGWKLAAALRGAPETLLASYEAERRPVAAEVLGLSTKLLDAALARSDRRRGRETHQLDLGYPDTPLSLIGAGDRGVLDPGDRAPDAPCRGAAGQPMRLFDAFRGTHWTLLGFDTTRSEIAARRNLHIHIVGAAGDIRDEGGHIRAAYGSTSGWVLVRPDGYIGAVVPAAQVSALRTHMDGLGILATN